MDVSKGGKPRSKNKLPRKLLKEIEAIESKLNLQEKISSQLDKKQKLNIKLSSTIRRNIYNFNTSSNSGNDDVQCTDYINEAGLINSISGSIIQFDSENELILWSRYTVIKDTLTKTSNEITEESDTLPVPVTVPQKLQNEIFSLYKDFALKEAKAFFKKVPNGAIVTFEDCESASYIGLLHAINVYNARSGVKFQVFARIRIRGAMIDQLRVMQNFPRSVSKTLREAKPVISQLRQKLSKEPTVDEIDEFCNQAGLTELADRLKDPLVHSGVYNESNNYSSNNSSGEYSDNDKEEALYANAIDYRGTYSNNSSRREYLIGLVQSLISTEEMNTIIFGYYFFKMTHKMIGFALNLSPSSIVVKRRKAIEELRHKLRDYKNSLLQEIEDE